ncbi:hypothetical protein ABZ891_23245 [Streptomyces sp. NPDC047023]|uniref:hypothetical protein n=1 Tax=Streptomyces sp. NPDC047023 TaxID=3155139 RepID=UPI0033DBF145
MAGSEPRLSAWESFSARPAEGGGPLPSSTSFLSAPTRPGIHTDVRDLVFTENQGLPFTTAVFTAHPSIPD